MDTMDPLSQKVDNLYDPDNFFINICDLYIFELLLAKTPNSSFVFGPNLGSVYAGINC
jgi:hypothetical protein